MPSRQKRRRKCSFRRKCACIQAVNVVNLCMRLSSRQIMGIMECVKMIEKWTADFPLPQGSEPRTVYVYLPEEAAEDEDARYPVLYMFDGHNVFFDEDATYGKCWGMKEYMDATETPMIIVAVDCNHHPDNGRLAEYSPFNFSWKKLNVKGRGKATMDWFAHTLKPMIDEKYPTIPEREATFIAGSSMGGLMSLYAVTAYNDVYSRAACLSPSLWTAPWRVSDLVQRAKYALDTVIYMDYGSREMGNRKAMQKLFASVTARLMEKKVWVTSRIVPNGDHCEACWEEQIPLFMHVLEYNRE